MDLQTILDNAVNADRAEEMKTSPQLTVGELILLLKPIVAKQESIKKKYEHEATVQFDFADTFPTRLISWRGRYAELSFEYDSHDNSSAKKMPTVSEVLQMLEDCIGKTYEGYKGGDFVMGKTTPVWVDNYSCYSTTAIVGVIDNEYSVILETKYLKD